MALSKSDPWIPAPKEINGRRLGRPKLPVGFRRATKEGYIVVKIDDYTWKAEHRIICEEALGHALPPLATIYHVNGDVCENANNNLVICEDYGYLAALKARRRIQKLGLDPWKFHFINGHLMEIE